MSQEEKDQLNITFLAYMRMTNKMEFPENIKFNLLFLAIKWKIINEFTPKTKTEEEI